LPRPERKSGPSILIGGNGRVRTLPLVVRFADEWNANFIPTEEVRRLNRILDNLLEAGGRHPGEVRRSFMTGCVFGSTDAEVRERCKLYGDTTPKELQEEGNLVGTSAQVAEQLAQLVEIGLDRVMLQWLDIDDLDGLEALAEAVL